MFEKKYHTADLAPHSFLVTGGAGFIGSNIVEYLLRHGAGKVRVLDNFATGKRENVSIFAKYPQYEFMEGDICDLETCRRACAGIEYVSHQAALGSVPRSIQEPYNTNKVNVGGFVNILTAAKDAGVKMLVYASSSSVYGDEENLPKVESRIGRQLSPYAVSKYANELYADVFYRTYGLNIIGLRYFNIFGPRQDPNGPYAAVIPLFISGLLNNKPVYIDGDGEQTRDFTFVENAVQANILAMLTTNKEAVNEVFNVAVGENFTINELYHHIRSLLGSNLEPQYRAPRKGDVRDSLADISKAKKLLGYHPEYNFNEGLRLTVDYFRHIYT
ncbi:MAG: SDR family oxidoreductase [Chitinophagales bacterium]|nr:SDR family oxidoreductase [Chitinophagales bacterium]MDW8419122.1 SDR family oxidoreductase [Chitinophagales bacterium]